MEFPELGERCFVESCQQLDFLPFSCDSCRRVYCVNHKARDAHQCPEIENIKNSVGTPASSKSYSCELQDCISTELVPVACCDCRKNFCLRHRHPQDHQCEKHQRPTEPTLTPKEKVEAVIGRELKSERKGSKVKKLSKTAAKVALMKLKMHAVGEKTVPQIDRVYFNVQLPSVDKDNHTTTCPMFFSKTWTIGKIIDNIASIKSLKNTNNVAEGEKLRVFNENGDMLNASDCLQSLIDDGGIQLESNRLIQLCYTSPG